MHEESELLKRAIPDSSRGGFYKIRRGNVYKLDRHTLICAQLSTAWPLWKDFLKNPETDYFAPYAGPYVLFSTIAEKYNIIIVQPEIFICNHIIWQFENITQIKAVKL